MSYDGENQTAITKSCIESERLFKQEEELFYNTDFLFQNRLISTVECRDYRCTFLYLHTNLNERLGRFVNANPFKAFITDEFSNEQGIDNPDSRCPENYFVTKIYCFRRHCDNKRLLCQPLISGAGVMIMPDIAESNLPGDFFTLTRHTTGMGHCDPDYYVVGIQCAEHRCRLINLVCQKVMVR